MAEDFSSKYSILGRSEKDIEQYGARGTSYYGKVVMSSGQNPVLGRKVMIDLARPHLVLVCGKRGGGKCLTGDTEILTEGFERIQIRDLVHFPGKRILALNDRHEWVWSEFERFFERKADRLVELTVENAEGLSRRVQLTLEHLVFTSRGFVEAQGLREHDHVCGTSDAMAFGVHPAVSVSSLDPRGPDQHLDRLMHAQMLAPIGVIEVSNSAQSASLLRARDTGWFRVKSVRSISGDFLVYDLSVPHYHNFVANGLVVHNSYSMAVFIEEFQRLEPEVKSRTSCIVIDTVGIFWSLKIPTRDKKLLAEWDLEPQSTDIRVLVPKTQLEFYKEKGIDVDGALSIKTSELESSEWLALFRLTWKDPAGILLSRVVETAKSRLGTLFGIDGLIKACQNDSQCAEDVRQSVINRLQVVKSWNLFEKEGTRIREIAKPGHITVIDVSSYRQSIGAEGTKDVIVGLLGKKLFEERMLYRKEEEIKLIKGQKRESSMPIVWLMIDEAHMFMPKDEDNIALRVLLEWVRVGRQPGLSLLLATQRPERLHPDAISQCDIFISHRMTSAPDIQAVSALQPTYLHSSLEKVFAEMPRGQGYATFQST